MTAILVPVHNALNYAIECIESVLAASPGYIHIYDDASDDETRDYLDSLRGVYYLRNAKPMGYAHHLNTLAMWAQRNDHRLAMVCNSDVVMGPRAADKLVTAFASRHAPLFAGPALSYAKSGQGEDEQLRALFPLLNLRAQLAELETNRQPRDPEPMATVNGACFAFHLHAWEQYGPFDERFGRGSAEEEEWMRRVNRLSGGDRGLYIPDALVYHHGHASFGAVKDLDTKALWRHNNDAMKAKQSGECWPDHVRPTSQPAQMIDFGRGLTCF